MSSPVHLPLARASEPTGCGAGGKTGLAPALIVEIAECLAKLADGKGQSAIDLRSLPMTDGDRDELSQILGRGELSMSLALSGESEIWETAYPGVWRVLYRNRDGDVIGDFIEITTMPQIAVAHIDDVQHSRRRLARWLEDEHGRRAAR